MSCAALVSRRCPFYLESSYAICKTGFYYSSSACSQYALPALAENVACLAGQHLRFPLIFWARKIRTRRFPLGDATRIYPYTLLDDLTDRREAKSYKAVYLENEFLKAIVLPELGGHVYSLYDKVNKHEVFYRNNVVKYGLVSLRGAWVSGGVEFNFPNGHTVVTVSPVAFTTMQNSDGSATVVVGDIDLVTEMHWEVALTLRPGQARLEQHVTLFNDTGLSQSLLVLGEHGGSGHRRHALHLSHAGSQPAFPRRNLVVPGPRRRGL